MTKSQIFYCGYLFSASPAIQKIAGFLTVTGHKKRATRKQTVPYRSIGWNKLLRSRFIRKDLEDVDRADFYRRNAEILNCCEKSRCQHGAFRLAV